MRFTLTIDCDNAAFGDGQDPTAEVRRILSKLAVGENGVRDWPRRESGKVMDHNGNSVGSWEIVP